mgnify:CR=1 FL=1
MKGFAGTLALGLCGALVLMLMLGWVDPGARELRDVKHELAIEQAVELAPLQLTVKRALLGSLAAVSVSAALIAMAGGLVALASVPHGIRAARLWSWLVRPTRHGAQYPALAAPDGQGHFRIIEPVNEPGSQRIAALTTGLDAGVRLQGSAVRQALRQDDPQAMLPEPEPLVEVEPAQRALAIDPEQKPHWLIVGQTGSGKSTATRYIMTELARQHRVEYIICEPGGIDWNSAASAVTQRGIAEAIAVVYREFDRRQEILRQADVAHISQLDTRLPYLYLVVEELEAVLDDLKVMDRGLANETLINLRQIARMGRKPGVGLIAVTQAARTDVFDSHVRTNLANVLLFRNGQGTAEMFRVGQSVTLPGLPTGEAFSMAHGHRLRFPMVPRPDVPMSTLYHEAPASQGQQPAQPATIDAEYRAVVADSATVPTVALPKRMPTPAEAAAMRAHYRRTQSKTSVCRAFYGYKDGDVWAWVEAALEGAL